nr:unnamed protein product [Spirometra erinaceieuropaei]
MQVLRHEASFNTADAKPVNMIAAVESILSQTGATDETKNLIRHQVSSLLMAHRPRDVLSKVERDALKELRADNDLVIVPADKGRSTVVLDRTDYNQKAKSLLEDRQSYVPCESNPMKTLTREINATLLGMENSGAISPIDRRMARAQETALARFYGLPKVHKEGAPLRPIVSLKGTPTYGLAKWLFQRLKFLTSDSNTTVSSSTQFLEKLKGVSLLPSDIMVSFDVTSLFTSIPQDLAVETIELLLREKYDETENRLGHAQIIQLLKFCLKTYFTFGGTIYEQVKGTPMGSPISGLIAEAVLQRLESLVFRHHRPKFWARYVDDTFVVIERDQVLTFKEQLNAVFPDIQFTMEEEENNQLAFLDVLVCRKHCGGLKTKVFRKATNTTQILNFNSNHPISHKRSCRRSTSIEIVLNDLQSPSGSHFGKQSEFTDIDWSFVMLRSTFHIPARFFASLNIGAHTDLGAVRTLINKSDLQPDFSPSQDGRVQINRCLPSQWIFLDMTAINGKVFGIDQSTEASHFLIGILSDHDELFLIDISQSPPGEESVVQTVAGTSELRFEFFSMGGIRLTDSRD